jgi:drug/metabolite transporter (DMT)-like permease
MGETTRFSSVAQALKALTVCTAYIALSGGLINFNNYLITKGRFPHPMPLTAMHMIGNLLICSLVLLVRPSAMPSFENCKANLVKLYKYLAPIATCMAITLYGSNAAYLYSSVAFLQFMKEANVVLVFVFSALVGLQFFNRQRVVVIVWIIMGSSLCVSGDLHFVFIGFMLQGISQLTECVRAVVAELVLTDSEFELDPLSYTFFVAPVCFLVLAVGIITTWDHDVITDLAVWWPYVIPNACLAFCLNVAATQVIKETSAMGYIIAGVVKDVVLVVFSWAVFHDSITREQWISFTVTLAGVFFWSFMKVCPEHTLVKCFETVLGVGWGPFPGAPMGRKHIDSEATPLVGEKRV